MAKKKEVTNEELLRVVETGFLKIATEFKGVHEDHENLARMVQVEFKAIHETMASKEDLREGLLGLKQELVNRISHSAEHTDKEVSRLREWVVDIDNRLMTLEGKRHRRVA